MLPSQAHCLPASQHRPALQQPSRLRALRPRQRLLLTSFSNAGRECSSQKASGSPSVARKASCCPAPRAHSTWNERQHVPNAHCLRQRRVGTQAW